MNHSRPEFRHGCGAAPLLQLLIESNLAEMSSEAVLLLKAIITIPMIFVKQRGVSQL